MGRRRGRKPKPPPMCFDCGRRLAWLPAGADAHKPVDPASKFLLADARTLGEHEAPGPDEVMGYDRLGYRMWGRRIDNNNGGHDPQITQITQRATAGRVVEVWNYHACDPADRAAFQARKAAMAAPAALGGQDRAAGGGEG